MSYRPTWWSKSSVLLVSVLLGNLTAHALFETPNVVGGGDMKMIATLVLMMPYEIGIEYDLTRSERKKAAKKPEAPPDH